MPLAHEAGHLFHAHLQGGIVGYTGTHGYCKQTKDLSGNISAGFAFAEGFADWFANYSAVGCGYDIIDEGKLVDGVKQPYFCKIEDDNSGVEVFNCGRCTIPICTSNIDYCQGQGMYEEVHVASLLWDLLDNVSYYQSVNGCAVDEVLPAFCVNPDTIPDLPYWRDEINSGVTLLKSWKPGGYSSILQFCSYLTRPPQAGDPGGPLYGQEAKVNHLLKLHGMPHILQ